MNFKKEQIIIIYSNQQDNTQTVALIILDPMSTSYDKGIPEDTLKTLLNNVVASASFNQYKVKTIDGEKPNSSETSGGDDDDDKSKAPMVAGIVIALVVVVALVILLYLFVHRRRTKR